MKFIRRLWCMLTFWRQPLIDDELRLMLRDIREVNDDGITVNLSNCPVKGRRVTIRRALPIVIQPLPHLPLLSSSRAPAVASKPKKKRFVIRSEYVGFMRFPGSRPDHVPPETFVGMVLKKNQLLPVEFVFEERRIRARMERDGIPTPHDSVFVGTPFGQKLTVLFRNKGKRTRPSERRFEAVHNFTSVRIVASFIRPQADLSEKLAAEWGQPLFIVEILS